MQVGAASTSTVLLPLAIRPRRDDVADRSTPEQRKPQAIGTAVDPAEQREVTRIRTRASAATQQASSRAQETLRDLPERQRGALQSYLSNGPSIQERLGVELVGIDVFA